MSIPYFEIEKGDDYDNVAEIINEDNEPKHFVRQRTYTPSNIDNDVLISKFNPRKYIRRGECGFFKAVCSLFLATLVFGAMSIYVGVKSDNPIDFIALFLTAGFLFALFMFFLVLHVCEHSFINSQDDLFILYDYVGTPCSVEVRKNRARVLDKDTLYIIKHNRIKTVRKDEKLYRAYLNLYPPSVLDMGKYLGNFAKAPDDVITSALKSSVGYMPDGNTRFSVSANQMTLGTHTSWHTGSVRYLQFCKFLFVVDNNLKIKSIYSAVSDDAFYDYSVLAFADATEYGQSAIDSLISIAKNNKALGSTLKDILYL